MEVHIHLALGFGYFFLWKCIYRPKGNAKIVYFQLTGLLPPACLYQGHQSGKYLLLGYWKALIHQPYFSVAPTSATLFHGLLPSLPSLVFLDELALPSIAAHKIPDSMGETLALLISLSHWGEKPERSLRPGAGSK